MSTRRRLACVLTYLSIFLLFPQTAKANHVLAIHAQQSPKPDGVITIPVGKGPVDAAVDPVTHRLYVLNQDDMRLSVFDASTYTPLDSEPILDTSSAVAVDTVTHRVYLTAFGLDIFDGSSVAPLTNVYQNGGAVRLAIDAASHLAFVSQRFDDTLAVFDERRNAFVGAIDVGRSPVGVAVDSQSRRIYVANSGSNTLSVIDESNLHTIGSIQTGNKPWAVAVNSATHRVYVTNADDESLSVYDESRGFLLATIGVGGNPTDIAVDDRSDTIYVSNEVTGTVSEINGATNTAGDQIVVGNRPMAVVINTLRNEVIAVNHDDGTIAIVPTCRFVLGFRMLHDLDPAAVGQCVDNQSFAADGDAVQHTTNGLLVWRKADNWTAFTDGYHTWVNGPDGVRERLNTQRFPGEANPSGLPETSQ